MDRLTQLRAELHELTASRAAALAELNREYDRRAIELNREIEELAPIIVCAHCGYKYGHRIGCLALTSTTETPQPKRRAKRAPRLNTAGLSPEEIDHMRKLREGK